MIRSATFDSLRTLTSPQAHLPPAIRIRHCCRGELMLTLCHCTRRRRRELRTDAKSPYSRKNARPLGSKKPNSTVELPYLACSPEELSTSCDATQMASSINGSASRSNAMIGSSSLFSLFYKLLVY
jgi:hypothetical protein